MRLGDVLMAEIAGDVLGADDFEDQDDWADDVIALFGSQRAAARELGVPRSTLRGWLAGRTPKRGTSWMAGNLADRNRRQAVADRADAVRAANADSIRIHGTVRYRGGGTMKGAENRDAPVGLYLDEGVIDALIDAAQAGAGPDELAAIFHEHINDNGWFAQTFDPNGPAYWDIDWIEGLS